MLRFRYPESEDNPVPPAIGNSRDAMKFKPNKILRKFGFEIRRLPSKKQVDFGLDDAEIANVEQLLQAFADDCPPDSACASYVELRNYLSDQRIAFFEDVIRLCTTHGMNLNQGRVADVGTGTGYLLRVVNRAAPDAEIWGFDTFEEMLGLARRLCPAATFEVGSLFEIEHSFDVVFCTETLEHMVEPADALLALTRLLTPGGTLVLTVPDGRKDQHAPVAIREDGRSYWGHINFWSPESWELFLRRELDPAYDIECGLCDSGENHAFIRAPEAS